MGEGFWGGEVRDVWELYCSILFFSLRTSLLSSCTLPRLGMLDLRIENLLDLIARSLYATFTHSLPTKIVSYRQLNGQHRAFPKTWR